MVLEPVRCLSAYFIVLICHFRINLLLHLLDQIDSIFTMCENDSSLEQNDYLKELKTKEFTVDFASLRESTIQ